MKTLYPLILILLLLTTYNLYACLPEGIIFSSQQQIDDFIIDYPECVGIEGDVTIQESLDGSIVNLDGLSNLTSIEGTLMIRGNNGLISLAGLNNLVAIEKNLTLYNNSTLINLNGLSNLISIGDYFNVVLNNTLLNLSGLGNLSSVGIGIKIDRNDALVNLTGLGNITSISGPLLIWDNDALLNLTGLESVTSVEGSLDIYSNGSMVDLAGLENLTSVSPSLYISSNNALTNIAALGNITSASLGGELLVRGNDVLVDLTGLENFTSVGLDLSIEYNGTLIDLTGLGNIISVGRDLKINNNDALISLTGLDDIASIGWALIIKENSNLVNLFGLETLISIGKHLDIRGNATLASLTGLDNVTSIGGHLFILNNLALTTLSGIQNIDPNSIKAQINGFTDLVISGNPNLSECEVQSICTFLDLPDKTKEIAENGTNCNSEMEVEAICPELICTSNSQVGNVSCFNVCDGMITILNVDGAISPLSYTWNTGADTSTLTNLCEGEYMVTITSANGCSVLDTFIINQPEEITVTVDSVIDILLPSLGAVAITTNNNVNYEFEWSGPNGFISNTEDLESLSEVGCYTLLLTNTVTNCTKDTTVCIDDLTFVQNLESLSAKVKLFPNPTSGIFNIDFSKSDISPLSINVYDISGRKIDVTQKWSIVTHSVINIDAKSLVSGIYFLEIDFKEGVLYKRIIVGE